MLPVRFADSGGAVKVFGDERQRVATLVREVAPFGLLAPAAAVERLVTDALSHAGQVRASTHWTLAVFEGVNSGANQNLLKAMSIPASA